MDELKIKTKLMRGILSKIIESSIKKKTGYKIKIRLNDVDVSINDNVAYVHLDANGEISVDEFKKFLRINGLEDWDFSLFLFVSRN